MSECKHIYESGDIDTGERDLDNRLIWKCQKCGANPHVNVAVNDEWVSKEPRLK